MPLSTVILSRAKDPRERTEPRQPLGSFARLLTTALDQPQEKVVAGFHTGDSVGVETDAHPTGDFAALSSLAHRKRRAFVSVSG